MSYKKSNGTYNRTYRRPSKKQIQATLDYLKFLVEEDDKFEFPNI
jgi:hypothetical protein